MSSGPTNLYDTAAALLGAVVTAFANAGVSIPSEQYVTAVLPVAMCDTVAVTWDNIQSGWPGQQQAPGPMTPASTYFCVLSVWIFRCLSAVPEGTGQQAGVAPTVAQFQADALQIMTDAFTLYRGLRIAKYQGWYKDFTQAIELGPCIPVAADGGMSGVSMTVTLELT